MRTYWGILIHTPPPASGWTEPTWEALLDEIVDYCEAHGLAAGGGSGPDGVSLGVSPSGKRWRRAADGDAHRAALTRIVQHAVPGVADDAVTVCDFSADPN